MTATLTTRRSETTVGMGQIAVLTGDERASAVLGSCVGVAIYDETKSIAEGAILIPGYTMDGWYGRIFRGCGFFDPDKPIKNFTQRQLHDLLYKEPTKIKVEGINITYEGIIPKIQKSMLAKDVDAMQPHIRVFVDKAVVFTACPECEGTRLRKEARFAPMLAAAKDYGGADVSLQNGGGTRSSIAAGDFKVGDAFNILPFRNTLVILDLSGAELVSALNAAAAKAIADYKPVAEAVKR